jgi:uncharacterized protein (TIGR03083 family)
VSALVSQDGPIGHDEAMALTAVENARFADLLDGLDGVDWAAPTDCTGWNVRDLVVHVTASAQAQASPVEFVRQVRAGRPLTAEIGGVHWVDGLNEAQLRARTDWQPVTLPSRWRTESARALSARTSMPGLLRRLPLLPIGKGLGVDLGWKPLGYLFDMGFTRDVWMHRVDAARATGRDLVLTAEHDGRLVADVVAEWATTHDDPYLLELTGPAGGSFARGDAGPDHVLQLDAVDALSIMSGRGEPRGPLRHRLPL